MMVYIILSGYSDGSLSSVEVVGVFSTVEMAQKIVDMIRSTEPSKSLKLVASPVEYLP